jgi:predicted adenylyl cyclase CyaB
MKEIEVLYSLENDITDVMTKLEQFEHKGAKKTLDIYFVDEKRDDLKPSNGKIYKCFRLRDKNGSAFITYKNDHYDGETWLYSDEHETKVKSFEQAYKIIECLGLKELVKIDNTKHTFVTPNYEIVIEEVKDLGCFLEVELLISDDVTDVAAEKQKIRDFVTELGLNPGEELNSGKPELMLIKQGKI